MARSNPGGATKVWPEISATWKWGGGGVGVGGGLSSRNIAKDILRLLGDLEYI